MKGEGGVAGEGRVVGVPKFHSWGKCTMPLTNINSDWISNASSGLCINYVGPLFRILGCNMLYVCTLAHIHCLSHSLNPCQIPRPLLPHPR